MLPSAMQCDGGGSLVRRDVSVRIVVVCAGWSARTRDSATPDTWASLVDLADLGDIMVVKGKLEVNESKGPVRRVGTC